GEHIHQAGSLVKHDRLRFDFTHFEAVNDNELEKIEQIVNEKIWANIPVVIETMDIDSAKELGAMALYGEKYGDVVRVVQLDDYSIELCGGIHVNNSAEIGLFKIVSEAGIGAGTRRIEAVTSKEAYTFMQDKLAILTEAASLLKTKDSAVVEKVHALQDEMKELARENESLQQKASNEQSKELLDKVESVNGIDVLAAEVAVKDMNQLRNMMDQLKEQLTNSVILLAAENNGKVQLIAGVSKELVERKLHAGKLIGEAAKKCKGGGGGRPDMAQAGGKDPSKINEALQTAEEYVQRETT